MVSLLAPIGVVFVATHREPPAEDNAGFLFVIFFAYAQCAQKYAYGTTKTKNKKQHKKSNIKHISNSNNSNLHKHAYVKSISIRYRY